MIHQNAECALQRRLGNGMERKARIAPGLVAAAIWGQDAVGEYIKATTMPFLLPFWDLMFYITI